MRRILSLPFEEQWLLATIEGPATATVGWLFVTGGTQTRVGPHRLYERLARRLAERGDAVIRFDRPGVGDSPGVDTGYRASGPGMAAAVAALRSACPGLATLNGFGLCDGATALCLHRRALGIDRLVLANPWVIEPRDDLPPAAAIRGHYAERLRDPGAWRALLAGRVRIGRLARGLVRGFGRDDASLVGQIAAGIDAGDRIALATGDGTARAFASAWAGLGRRAPTPVLHRIDTPSHSFAPRDAFEALARVLEEAGAIPPR